MFGFPKANRADSENFKTNLLRSVVIKLEYDHNNMILQKKDQIASLFSNKLQRVSKILDQGYKVEAGTESSPVFKPSDQANSGYQLRSQDGQKVLTFTASSIIFELGGDVYSRFESLQEENELIRQALNLCSVKLLTKIGLRKINMAKYTTSETDVDSHPFEFADFALNSSISSIHTSFPGPKFIQQSIHSVNYASNEAFMNVKYGLFVSPTDHEGKHLVVDIDIYDQAKTPVGAMMGVLEVINNEIYNVFHWVMSDGILESLRT